MEIVRTKPVKLPTKNDGDAGYDFYLPTHWNNGEKYLIRPQEDVLIPLGVKVNVPAGHALIAFNKSGVCTKQQLQVGACVVDESYTGEIHAHMINYSSKYIFIQPGQKIVQFILIPYKSPAIKEVSSFKKDTNRGTEGFGSTGLK